MNVKLLVKYRMLPSGLKASFWFLICNILQKGISTITTPVFTRLLTTYEYGRYNVFISWLSLLTVIITLSISNDTFMRGFIKYQDDKENYTSSMQGLLTALVLTALGIYLLTHTFWNRLFNLSTGLMILIFISMWMCSVLGFWSMRQRMDYRYRAMIIITLLSSFLKPVSGILAIVFWDIDKVDARAFTLVGVEVLCFGWLAITQWKRSRVFYNKKYWHYAMLLNLPLLPHYLAENVLSQSDKFMIERMVGADKAGIYSLACSISMIMLIINSSIETTLSPFIYKNLDKKNYKKVGTICYLSLAVIAVANIILIALAPEIVSIFAPAEYKEAIWVVPPIALSLCFRFLYMIFSKIEFYYEKTKHIMIISGTVALINIVLNAVFIPLFGYFAAGYTTLLCYVMFALAHYGFAKKAHESTGEKFHEIFNMKIIIVICSLFLAFAVLFVFMYQHTIIRLCSVFAVAVLTIIILFYNRKALKKYILY